MSSASRKKRVVIVGAGMAGLTAAGYLARDGHEVIVYERSSLIGGLVQSFERDGFVFDAGPRAIGNAGIIRPMLKDLAIDLPLMRSKVSTGIAGTIISYDSLRDIDCFVASLESLFPDERPAINTIAKNIRSYSRMMEVLNRVDNPYFRNIPWDASYMFAELIPWLPTFLSILMRTAMGKESVERALAKTSASSALKDMVSQAFFRGTPREFAFGYYHNFLDYLYPFGGTGELPKALRNRAEASGARFRLDTAVTEINPASKTVVDSRGGAEKYDALLWAADLKTLYAICRTEGLPRRFRRRSQERRAQYERGECAESVFSVFIACDLPPEYFSRISHGHFLYTPETHGLGDLRRGELDAMKGEMAQLAKEDFLKWLDEFCRYNSCEISIPALKDRALAPPGRTGLIVSVLFDGEFCMALERRGWYAEFKERCAALIIDRLSDSVYPGLGDHILFREIATPITLMRMFGSANGAIVGWSPESAVPVARHLSKIQSAVRTPIPGVFQAGQWTYSPSGVPVAVLTGRIAAARITKTL